jgi:hypothetical protein
MSFAQWVDILNGESVSFSEHYCYEGERFVANWRFDITDRENQLYITYGDNGGEGWLGDFDQALVLQGAQIDGVDIAKLCLEASPHRRGRFRALTRARKDAR